MKVQLLSKFLVAFLLLGVSVPSYAYNVGDRKTDTVNISCKIENTPDRRVFDQTYNPPPGFVIDRYKLIEPTFPTLNQK